MIASVSSTAREYCGGFSGFSRVEVVAHLGPALEAPAAGQRDQLDAAAVPFAGELVEQRAQRVGADLVGEQGAHVAQRQRLAASR